MHKAFIGFLLIGGLHLAVSGRCCMAQGDSPPTVDQVSRLTQSLQAASSALERGETKPTEFISQLDELRTEYAGLNDARLRISAAEIAGLRHWNLLHDDDAAVELLQKVVESHRREPGEALADCRLLVQDLQLQIASAQMDAGNVRAALENLGAIVEFSGSGPGFDERQDQFKAQHLSAARSVVLDYRVRVEDLRDFAVMPFAALQVAAETDVDKARAIKWMPAIQRSYQDLERALEAQMEGATDAERDVLSRAREIIVRRRAEFNAKTADLAEQISRQSAADLKSKFPPEIQKLLQDAEKVP